MIFDMEAWERDMARLENQIRDIRTLVERIDTTGTRGILPLTVQVTELAKDVAKLEVTLERKLPTGINWRTIVAFVAVTAPMYGLLAQQLFSTRH